MAAPPREEHELQEVEEDEELEVFRIVRTPDVAARGYVDSFRSHAELGIPPRGPEETHPLVYKGVSAFDTPERAAETARRFPRIGKHIARLRIRRGDALYFFWGARGHLTLWGDPIKLSETTVDTIPVD